ncbi:MAG: serine/threonine protein kinase [Deltaproteobacteria bacterium]|nr:serine/threonine protein kinase [Deltaproteobacteria bacterium]
MTDSSLPFELSTPKYPRDHGGYLLLKPIPQGGMGAVHLAKQGGGTERECVVKTLRSIHTDSAEHLRRFLDEARVVQRLEHRNICRTSDVGVVGSTPYLVMDWVSGRDLRAVQGAMADGTGVPIQTRCFALHVVQRVLRALEYAHQIEDERTLEQLRIVHRDVSPQNVMVSFSGEVKLIDFGLAASTMKTEHTARGSIMGKLAYMAPEQLREEPLDGRCDLFACGIMLYELLCSERFYAGLTEDEMWECVAYGGHTPAKLHNLPDNMRVVVEKACVHRKEDRYRTCGELAEILRGLAENSEKLVDKEQISQLMSRLFPEGDREEAKLLNEFSARHLTAANATAHLPKPGARCWI